MTNRCEKHQIFIGKNGCKICNEAKYLFDDAKKYHNWFMEELKKNDQLREENNKLKCDAEYYEKNYNRSIAKINLQKDNVEQLKSPKVPEAVKFAIKYLTRNEKQIMINLLGAQSMLAVLVDHFNSIPANRKNAILPLYDYVIEICEKVDYLNSEIAEHMAKQLDTKTFNNIINDVASVCDFMAGKIIKCKTCTAWLDNKAKNRRM
jgi:hypothetical protein